VTLTLTAGVDDLVGTAMDDTIIATTATLTPGDKVDAGAGIDTMTLTDTATAPGSRLSFYSWLADVLGVENLNLATTGGLDASFPNGNLTKLNVNAAGSGDVSVWTWWKTSVAILGANMPYASVKYAAEVSIDNTSAAGVSGQGTSLKKATLDNIIGAASVIKGAGLTTLELKNMHQNTAVKVVNPTAGHALTLEMYEAGIAAYGDPAVKLSVEDAVATAVSIVANGGNALTLATPKATTLGLSGNGWITLDLNASINTKLVSINGSAISWGGISLSSVPASVRTIATGAGHDKLNVALSSVKDDAATTGVDETSDASINTGAGDDSIVLSSTGNGRVTLDAGLGGDKLVLSGRTGNETLDFALNEGGDIFDAAPGVTIKPADRIDGGQGYGADMLSLRLVDAANAGAFSGFETLDIAGLDRTVDLALISAKNKIDRVILSGPVGTAGLGNLPTSARIDIVADMGAGTLAVQRQPDEWSTLQIRTSVYEQITDLAADSVTATISVAGAKNVSLSMESGFQSALPGETSIGDDLSTVNLTLADTTSLAVNADGYANNVLNLSDPNHKLTSLSLSGNRPLTLNFSSGSLQYVHAYSLYTGLHFSTAVMANGGVIYLGSGQDNITLAASADVPKMVALLDVGVSGVAGRQGQRGGIRRRPGLRHRARRHDDAEGRQRCQRVGCGRRYGGRARHPHVHQCGRADTRQCRTDRQPRCRD
jgi:trimeric autotransporter adhesin